jgi:tetratricopeptide (TPR) repeat protein
MVTIKDEREQLRALESLFREKRFSDALVTAQKIKEEFPNSFQIRFLHVRILEELNRLGEAETVLIELMQRFSNNITLLLESGKVCTNRNKYNEALEYYNKILFLDPFNSEAKTAIDKINIIKKNGFGNEKGNRTDRAFISYSSEKLDRADTLPEFEPGASALNRSRAPSSSPSASRSPSPPPPPPIPEEEDILPLSLPEEEEEGEILETGLTTVPPVPDVEEAEIAESLFDYREEGPETKIAPPLLDVGIEEEFKKAENAAEKGGNRVDADVDTEVDAGMEFPDMADMDIEIPEVDRTEMAAEVDAETDADAAMDIDRGNDQNGESGVDFVTESAAELYLKQGLVGDALVIYKKLYDSRKEERFLVKINQLRKRQINEGQILVLTEFLRLIKQKQKHRGDKIV